MDPNAKIMSDDLPDHHSPIDREAYAWVMRFASGRADEADLAALKQWSQRDPAHAAAFTRVSRTWKGLGDVRRDGAGSLARTSLVPAHLAAAKLAPATAPRLGRRAFLGGAMAASAVAGAVLSTRPPLGLWPTLSELSADYRTATGEQRSVVLPDSSSIKMNTQTSIAIQPSDGGSSAIELISGEAMFAAAAHASGALTVNAANGRTIASNARFNVRYRDQAVCVTCLAGELRVERGAAAQSLSPGLQVVYSDRGMSSVATADPAQVAAWQDGVVIFQLTPVSEVIAEVNRYRSGKIILTNQQLGRRLFNARVRIANIDLVVSRIEQVFGAHATTLPGGIILLG